MKRKLNKKLNLNRTTIANLNAGEMYGLRGGDSGEIGCETHTCQTCIPDFCDGTSRCITTDTDPITSCQYLTVGAHCS